MLRMFFWLGVWVMTLGLLDVEVKYEDGLRIRLRSWPEVAWKAFKKWRNK